jgi:cytochrome oxidase Cu insertion factor (SCO1/SenC/PrrC family)
MLASVKVQKALFGVFIALLAAIAAVLVVDRVSSPAASRQTAEVTARDASALEGNSLPNVRAANFTLVNQNGKPVTLSHDRGHVVVLVWIHSLCKNDCPFMVEQIKGALNLLPHRGRGVDVIGVSVQPGQDTMHNRRWFIAQHEMTGRMQYVSGPLRVMRRVWKDYAIEPVTPKLDHSAFVFVLSKSGYEKIGFPSVQLTASALAHDIRVLERQRARA